MSLSSRVLNLHLPKKTFRRAFHARMSPMSAHLWWLCHSPVTEPLWSDYNSDTLYTVSDFMAAYQEGRSLTSQTAYRPAVGCYLLEDTSIRYWLLHNTASTCIRQVTIPNNRDDRPNLVQTLEHYILHCTDQHTRPFPPTVLVQQSSSINIGISISIGQFDKANIGTLVISIKPGIGRSLILPF